MSELLGERVERGAKALDVCKPGWFEGINIPMLSMSSCSRCIIGQVFNVDETDLTFTDGCTEVEAAASKLFGAEFNEKELGFDAPFYRDYDLNNQFEDLRRLWIEQIEARRAAQ